MVEWLVDWCLLACLRARLRAGWRAGWHAGWRACWRACVRVRACPDSWIPAWLTIHMTASLDLGPEARAHPGLEAWRPASIGLRGYLQPPAPGARAFPRSARYNKTMRNGSVVFGRRTGPEAMLSDDVTRIELEARKRALEEYKLRCQDLRSENEGLKSEKEEREMDALQVATGDE